MVADAMKAQNNTNSKSVSKNSTTALASLEWYQEFVRFVELRDIAPRTRETYLAWVRRLHEARPGRDITALTEGEALDFLVALRHERELKDSTINQAACALRGFYRDHLGRDWKAWSKIRIRREEQLPNVLSRDEVAKFLGAVRVGQAPRQTPGYLPHLAQRINTLLINSVRRRSLIGSIHFLVRKSGYFAGYALARNLRSSHRAWMI